MQGYSRSMTEMFAAGALQNCKQQLTLVNL